jgi:phosphoribosylformimino-5-aminoimidazole carboxamide ribotide isomerase
MIIYPDIEIQNGQSVNLPRGLREEPVTYSLRPRDAARQFQLAGAEWLHIVDLDGVFQGGRHNAELMCQIIEEAKVPVQIAGGIRTEYAVHWWFDHGATRVVLGTVAVKNQNLLRDVCARYPEKIVVSIDARGGYALIDGWRTRTSFTPIELARHLEDVGVAAIIYTDIDRFENHPESSFAATTEIAGEIRIPVISTGTVETLDDVSFLKYLPNISGVIVGRALFSEAVRLEDAIAVASGPGVDPSLAREGVRIQAPVMPKTRIVPDNKTLGQELLDLDQARKERAISDSEFERAKSDLLQKFSN